MLKMSVIKKELLQCPVMVQGINNWRSLTFWWGSWIQMVIIAIEQNSRMYNTAGVISLIYLLLTKYSMSIGRLEETVR